MLLGPHRSRSVLVESEGGGGGSLYHSTTQCAAAVSAYQYHRSINCVGPAFTCMYYCQQKGKQNLTEKR